jgi:hypothetical protein
MRILKPLRVVKLFKAVKLIGALKEELAILLGLTPVKLVVLFGYLVSSVHFCACGYWRVKLEASTKEEVADFLGVRRADSEVPRPHAPAPSAGRVPAPGVGRALGRADGWPAPAPQDIGDEYVRPPPGRGVAPRAWSRAPTTWSRALLRAMLPRARAARARPESL